MFLATFKSIKTQPFQLYRHTFKNVVPLTSRFGFSNITHDNNDEKVIPIPEYPWKENESANKKRARLIYQSRKRGMLENGILLSTFAARYLSQLTETQLEVYDKLINRPSNDWDIYHWITRTKEVPSEYDTDVMKMLQEHAENKDKELRNQLPDLNKVY